MSEHDHGFMELMAADDAWTPHPGDQAQAEQGMAQREHDDDLRRILYNVHYYNNLSEDDFKKLCAAVAVDLRDVT
jgi:hypothetical protein